MLKLVSGDYYDMLMDEDYQNDVLIYTNQIINEFI